MDQIPKNILLKELLEIIEYLECQNVNDIDNKDYEYIIQILKKCVIPVKFQSLFKIE